MSEKPKIISFSFSIALGSKWPQHQFHQATQKTQSHPWLNFSHRIQPILRPVHYTVSILSLPFPQLLTYFNSYHSPNLSQSIFCTRATVDLFKKQICSSHSTIPLVAFHCSWYRLKSQLHLDANDLTPPHLPSFTLPQWHPSSHPALCDPVTLPPFSFSLSQLRVSACVVSFIFFYSFI